jgi:hypothetical protein
MAAPPAVGLYELGASGVTWVTGNFYQAYVHTYATLSVWAAGDLRGFADAQGFVLGSMGGG